MHTQIRCPPNVTREGQSRRQRRPHGGGGRIAALLAASLVLGGALAGGARTAWAAGGDADIAAAMQKFDAGRQAFEKGAFEEALLAFQASYSLSPSPNSRLFIARCYRALGKTASAYTAYRQASREADDRLKATHEKRYTATRDAASGEGAELESKVARVTVVVPGGLPDGFSVKENGQELPKAAWGVATETDPGEVTVEATGPRLVPFRKVLTLGDGAQERVEVTVKRVPTAVLALELKSRPSGLTIAIDGAPADVAEAEKPRELDVGEHLVAVEAPGYAPFYWKQTLADGETQRVAVTLKTRGFETPKWLFYTVAGAAVAAEGGATGLALSAQSSQNAELAKDALHRSAATQSSIQSKATMANVLFISGGVLGLGAVTLAFTTHWKADASAGAPTVSFAPVVGPGSAGLGAHGCF